MSIVLLREMTADEFDRWQRELAEAYAAEQVSAGRWSPEDAVARARAENEQALPAGPSTPRMLVRTATDEAGEPVGRAWVGLDHPRGAPGVAFLYDIEVVPGRRGRGLGRALLAAVEQEAHAHGAEALELNVFGGNRAAIALYLSAGYEVSTQQMRKPLSSGDGRGASVSAAEVLRSLAAEEGTGGVDDEALP
ncbi:GNAT family N-acetyltransferase [Microbacterium resistens]|uniref:GNAT family N-acetyltransferase n=1 Tax=Microbacterium resistens TaxID=156977 RepID=UPI001C57DB1C|nr:GNAT family N-acetyltransferase [Microbacterium resistens]MBW1639409.1 GNAT family N-acetyltransferase [Microbacterium resistens]